MTSTTTKPLPDALRRARALEARHYSEPACYEADRRAVFGHSWQLVAHREQLMEPGDHVVEVVAGTPVILLRGRDGVLRAFPNVCRHRAGPLANCSGKGMHNLRCKYHGWLYDQEGRLIGAPEMQDAADFAAAISACRRCGSASGRASCSSRCMRTCLTSTGSTRASPSASRRSTWPP